MLRQVKKLQQVRTSLPGNAIEGGVRLRQRFDPARSNDWFVRTCTTVAELKTKNIALALQESVALRFSILQGVQDFARTRSDWNLIRSGDSLVLSWQDALSARPDGIIGFIGQDMIPALQATDIPIVCVNSIHNMPEFVRVRSDAHAVGELAAHYFLGLGYQEFAFCTDVPTHFYSQLRSQGFCDALLEEKLTARHIVLESSSSDPELKSFSQLKDLPRGSAVYCATDSCARRVLTYCEDNKLVVPHHLAILGTDNDPFYCEGGHTLLSSIDVNHRKIGAKAAETLSEIFEGASPPNNSVLIPPAKVVTRSSTNLADSSLHPLVVKALKTIDERADDPRFTTEELAKACGVSSRTIGRLFEHHKLRSPYQVLLNVRVGNAQRLLQESDLTADEIAYRCGFADYSSFYRVFKNHVGTSPSAYR